MTSISVNTITWNEATTIDLAMLSIVDIADEVILVDNGSTDDTVGIAVDMLQQWGVKHQVHDGRGWSLAKARHYAVKQSSGDWILVVDGDHCYNTQKGKPNIHRLRELTEQRLSDCYRIKYIQTYGDLVHAFKKGPVAPPHVALFKRSDQVVMPVRRKDLPEFLHSEMPIHEVFGCNLTGYKPVERLIARKWFTPWQAHNLNHPDQRFDNCLDYARQVHPLQLSQEYLTTWLLQKLRSTCQPLAEAGLSLADMPEIVQVEARHPQYQVLYEDGKIVGRHPDLIPGEYHASE